MGWMVPGSLGDLRDLWFDQELAWSGGGLEQRMNPRWVAKGRMLPQAGLVGSRKALSGWRADRGGDL